MMPKKGYYSGKDAVCGFLKETTSFASIPKEMLEKKEIVQFSLPLTHALTIHHVIAHMSSCFLSGLVLGIG